MPCSMGGKIQIWLMVEGVEGGGKGGEEKLAPVKSFCGEVLMWERKRKKGEKNLTP